MRANFRGYSSALKRRLLLLLLLWLTVFLVSFAGVASVNESAPIVTNATANRSIPEDTDCDPLWGENSTLNVTVVDKCNISSVTINLSVIGGSANQSMENVVGTNVWSCVTNASIGTAKLNGTVYVPHLLLVNATNEYGKSNVSASINLTVMKNGDVWPYPNGDGIVDFQHDALYLVRHVANITGYEMIRKNIAEVTGDGKVNTKDGDYLINHTQNVPGYEILH